MKSLKVVCLLLVATACTSAVKSGGPTTDATEASLMQADRDFAGATHQRGIDGWMSFFARDAIRIRYRANMVKGYDAVRAFDLPTISDTTFTLNWEPTDAFVFDGGTVGATTGRYWAVSRKSDNIGKELSRGRYVTMWRRDGNRWLVIMDTGYPEPAAANK